MSVEAKLYLKLMLTWAALLALYPPWKGKSYIPDQLVAPITESTIWREGGVFELEGGVDFRKHGPIWSPPSSAGGLPTLVRWPWQSPSGSHVELAPNALAGEFALGAIAIGLFVGGLVGYRGHKHADLIVTLAWWISLSLAAAWLAIGAAIVLTIGYAIVGPTIPAVLGLGLVAGVTLGAAKFDAQSRRAAEEVAASGRPPCPTALGGWPTTVAWFALGVTLASCLTLAAVWAADWFRGPVSNYEYVRPQWPVNLAAVAIMWAVAWKVGRRLARHAMPRAVVTGLLLAAAIQGAFFAYNYPPYTPPQSNIHFSNQIFDWTVVSRTVLLRTGGSPYTATKCQMCSRVLPWPMLSPIA